MHAYVLGLTCLTRCAILCAALVALPAPAVGGEAPRDVVIGLTAEFGIRGAHAAQSIELGIRLALEEINTAGGVLGGRRLMLEKRDDRGVPARAVDNFIDLAAHADVVAVFCGRFSPVALEIKPHANRIGLVMLDPWAAADTITEPEGDSPNYVFRLSLTDAWAMRALLAEAAVRGIARFALFVPNTAWGRSAEAALIAHAGARPEFRFETFWYNWGDTAFSQRLTEAQANGAQAVLMVANEFEALPIINQMAALPAAQRLPILAHWGLLAGDLPAQAAAALEKVDFSVVYTFSFADAEGARVEAVKDGLRRLFDVNALEMRAQVGFAHAYDLTHLLARAIERAGSSDRAAVRNALEQLGPQEGLVLRSAHPFSADRHEALVPEQVRVGRFDATGNVVPIAGRPGS